MSTNKMQRQKVYVVGVGMTKFQRPNSVKWDYPDMIKQAVERALWDSNVKYDQIQQAVVGYCYGDSTCGQRGLYEVGLSGIPIYNVNNNCSTGSTAMAMGKQLVEGGLAECVLAVGFEKMAKGSLGSNFNDRTNPMDKHMTAMMNVRGYEPKAPPAPQMFGNAGREHMEKYGTTKVHLAKIAEKNHRHSANNPYSQFRDIYSLDQILASPVVYEPLTKLQCCPTSDGAAAVVLCNEEFVKKHNLQSQAIEIVAQALVTDFKTSFEDSSMKNVGYDMTAAAAKKVFAESGISPNDVQVVELHDCFSANELITYEALGLCAPGKASEMIDSKNNTYGGKYVINPSGGLISKGHPLGATGLAQCTELCWQIRGMTGNRQVPNVTYALQHNIGLGGLVVVTLFKHGFPQQAKPYNRTPNFAVDADAQISPAPASATTSAPKAKGGNQVEAVFEQIEKTIQSQPDLVKQIDGVYQFNVGKEVWSVDLKSANLSKRVNKAAASPAAGCTITLDEDSFVGLMTGSLNAQQLFMQGQLKIQGNMALAMKLSKLSSTKSKL